MDDEEKFSQELDEMHDFDAEPKDIRGDFENWLKFEFNMNEAVEILKEARERKLSHTRKPPTHKTINRFFQQKHYREGKYHYREGKDVSPSRRERMLYSNSWGKMQYKDKTSGKTAL